MIVDTVSLKSKYIGVTKYAKILKSRATWVITSARDDAAVFASLFTVFNSLEWSVL